MKVSFLVNIDWFFFSHRLELYKSINNTYKTSIICGDSGYKTNMPIEYFESKGRIPTWKGVQQLKSKLNSRSSETVYIVVSPVMIFLFQLMFWRHPKAIYNFSGLGFLRRIPEPLLLRVLRVLFRRTPRGKRTIIVQNNDDLILFQKVIHNLESFYSCKLIPGSGFENNLQLIIPKLDKFRVGYVGRIRKDKGILTLIRAFNEFQKGVGSNNCELKIWGKIDEPNRHGFNKREMEELAENSKYFQGHNTDKIEIYSSFEFFCLPSNGEGLSKAAIEASAFRKILLLSDVPGNRDMIEDNGFLFKYNSSSSLIRCLQSAYFLNLEHKASMSDKSYQLYEQKWELNRIKSMWLDLLSTYDEN